MYPGSNNSNNQYPSYSNQQNVSGSGQIGFNVGQSGYIPGQGSNSGQQGGYNQQYVAGVPQGVSGQAASVPQGQFYSQVAPTVPNPGPGYYPNQGQQINPSYPGANPSYPGSNPTYPGANPSYPGSNPTYPGANPSYPGSNPTYPGANPSMAQQPNTQTLGGTCQPAVHGNFNIQIGQEQNPSAHGSYNPQMVQEPHPSVHGSSNPHTGQAQIPIHGSYEQIANQEMGESHKGTIKAHPHFNAEQDCNVLRTAMKGIGTDEKAIIECLGRRNLEQRLEIKKTFKTMFGKDLLDNLKSELSGNFSRVVIESLYDSDYYDAYSLHKAMEGAGTREDVLTEILTSRTNEEIENIKVLYKKSFNKDLEKDIISETSGFYKRILVSCLQANKKELTSDDYNKLRQQGASAVVNGSLASQEAAELYNAGEKKLGTDEAIFIKIFATRNKYQLRATFAAYEKLSGHSILKAIESEMSGDLASALKAIALQNMNEPLYFASRLYKAMKGAGTTDNALIRIILTRSEIDMENIKKEFQKQYNQTLEAFVKDDVSGDYLKYLLRFVEGN